MLIVIAHSQANQRNYRHTFATNPKHGGNRRSLQCTGARRLRPDIGLDTE